MPEARNLRIGAYDLRDDLVSRIRHFDTSDIGDILLDRSFAFHAFADIFETVFAVLTDHTGFLPFEFLKC